MVSVTESNLQAVVVGRVRQVYAGNVVVSVCKNGGGCAGLQRVAWVCPSNG